ncbi:MAG: imidazole glycerol phosphate synthase subunit HisH, partial [Candidatus Eremiobacteraeota bacterium]|nr:imidazole glycerol phosphate synthase subunit HisH [Candidatus Eremiobacteraeota bacterium]
MLAVVDYGGGNLGSLIAALARRSVAFDVTGDPQRLGVADAAILPGDGAFASTMSALRARGLDDALRAFVAAGRPFFGICI